MKPPNPQTTHEHSPEFSTDFCEAREKIHQLHLVSGKAVSPEGKEQYQGVEALRGALRFLNGKKFMLDCGHRVTFGYFLGNDIVVRNGKRLAIVCLDCDG